MFISEDVKPGERISSCFESLNPPTNAEIDFLLDPKKTTHSANERKQYEGEYELAPGFIITVTAEGNKLFAQATGQNKFELFAEKENQFFLKVVDAKIKFVRDENKKVTGLVLYQDGQEVEGKRR